MSKDFWNQDNVIMLIQLYESNKLLWDTSDSDYKNKYKRKDAYAAIATELGINNADEVKKKIESILAQFRREKKGTTLKSGMGTAEKKKPWWGLAYLQFLVGDKSTPRSTVSSLTQASVPAVDTDFSDNENDIDNDNQEISNNFSPQPHSSLKSSMSRSSTPGSGLESLSASGRVKRVKANQVNEAYNIMKSCYKDVLNQQPQLRDEYSVYGENIANRLRKIKNPVRVCRLQNTIDNLIFQAEMQEFEERHTVNTNQETRPAPSQPPECEVDDVSLLMNTSLLSLPNNFSVL